MVSSSGLGTLVKDSWSRLRPTFRKTALATSLGLAALGGAAGHPRPGDTVSPSLTAKTTAAVHGASFQKGPVAANTWLTFFGDYPGAETCVAQLAPAPDSTLPTTLCDASVHAKRESDGYELWLGIYYTSEHQRNVLAPPQLGTWELTNYIGNEFTNTVQLRVVDNRFAPFHNHHIIAALDANGQRHWARHPVTQDALGRILQIYGSGGDGFAGQPQGVMEKEGRPTTTPGIKINGVQQVAGDTLYAGTAPGLISVTQINQSLPALGSRANWIEFVYPEYSSSGVFYSLAAGDAGKPFTAGFIYSQPSSLDTDWNPGEYTITITNDTDGATTSTRTKKDNYLRVLPGTISDGTTFTISTKGDGQTLELNEKKTLEQLTSGDTIDRLPRIVADARSKYTLDPTQPVAYPAYHPELSMFVPTPGHNLTSHEYALFQTAAVCTPGGPRECLMLPYLYATLPVQTIINWNDIPNGTFELAGKTYTYAAYLKEFLTTVTANGQPMFKLNPDNVDPNGPIMNVRVISQGGYSNFAPTKIDRKTRTIFEANLNFDPAVFNPFSFAFAVAHEVTHAAGMPLHHPDPMNYMYWRPNLESVRAFTGGGIDPFMQAVIDELWTAGTYRKLDIFTMPEHPNPAVYNPPTTSDLTSTTSTTSKPLTTHSTRNAMTEPHTDFYNTNNWIDKGNGILISKDPNGVPLCNMPINAEYTTQR